MKNDNQAKSVRVNRSFVQGSFIAQDAYSSAAPESLASMMISHVLIVDDSTDQRDEYLLEPRFFVEHTALEAA